MSKYDYPELEVGDRITEEDGTWTIVTEEDIEEYNENGYPEITLIERDIDGRTDVTIWEKESDGTG